MNRISANFIGTIGEPAIRIILLKVMVGLEIEVYKSYKTFLDLQKADGKINDWWAYKLLGEYDICFIISRKDFDHDLAFAGTIEGITYSTEMLCYLWEGSEKDKTKSFRSDNFTQPLLCLSLLKIKPPLFTYKREQFDVESQLSAILEKDSNVFCLGSFGWGEFLLMYPSDSFKEIYSFLQEAHRCTYNNESGLFLKSFSQIGINYNHISPELKCTGIIKDTIKEKNGFYPSIRISCRPSEIKMIWDNICSLMSIGRKYYLFKEKNPIITLGPFDFSVDVKNGTWGNFIDSLIEFRMKFRSSLFKTHVQIKGINVCPLPQGRSWKYTPKIREIKSTDICKMNDYGHPALETILSTVYTINQYLQNELISDSIEDMICYVTEMSMIALKEPYKQLTRDDLLIHLEHMPENVKEGCNQRLGGFLLQEGAEDFSPFKGGKHRLTKALKALCKDIFDAIGPREWNGFVVIGRKYEYFHLAGVLDIPVNSAFHVDRYFGLFHEIGHVYLIYDNEVFTSDMIPVVGKTPLQAKEIDDVREQAREFFCDLFAFQCGFLGDYDLYMYALMSYLAEYLDNNRSSFEDLERYVSRLLCVKLHHMGGEKRSTEEIKPLAEELLDQFAKLVRRPEQYDERRSNLITNIAYCGFHSQKSADTFRKAYTKHGWSDFCSDRRNTMQSEEFKEHFNAIMEGKIIPELEHPHLIVLSFLKEKMNGRAIPFKAHVAAIQSFLDCYYRRGWDATKYLYTL